MAPVTTASHTGRRTCVRGMTQDTSMQSQLLRALSDDLQAIQKGKLLKLTISWETPTGATRRVELDETPTSRQMNGVGFLLEERWTGHMACVGPVSSSSRQAIDTLVALSVMWQLAASTALVEHDGPAAWDASSCTYWQSCQGWTVSSFSM